MLLSVVSGLAIGMGRIVPTVYVIDLGAGAAEIGAIGAAEALGKMIVTLPAGFLIYRFGARRVYSTATIGSMLFTALTPLSKQALSHLSPSRYCC
jgi:MFS family permease